MFSYFQNNFRAFTAFFLIFLVFLYNPAHAYSKSEIDCLTVAVFMEARGESYKGKLAVAEVIVNRKQHPKLFPKSICGVVTQRGQFSWYGGPRSLQLNTGGVQVLQIKPGQLKQPKDRSAYLDSKKAAVEALNGSDLTHGSLYFVHRRVVKKQLWLKKMKFRVMIGQHRFYGEP